MTSTDPAKTADPGPIPDTLKRARQYEFHPLSELFPLLEGSAFDALVTDIKDHGLQEPIWLYESKILDGRNRYRACQKAARETQTREYTGADPVGFVVSANLHRRHLKESQRAMIAAKLVTTKLGDNQWKVGQQINQPSAAKLLNVSAKSVQLAKEILDRATPEVRGFVESGKLPVSVAAKATTLPKEKQAELTTASKVREAVAGPGKKTDLEIAQEWLKALPIADLIYWLGEFHKGTEGTKYLRELSAALAKLLEPPVVAKSTTAPAMHRPL